MSLRFTTAGESHGPGLVAILEGLPAGLELDRDALDRDMARRQLGHGRGVWTCSTSAFIGHGFIRSSQLG